MPALPLILAAVVAALLAAPLLRTLADNGLVHENYRKATLPFPGGTACPALYSPGSRLKDK